jgi:tellurite resistance protein
MTMHAQDKAIVRALVPLAWADGTLHDREIEMIDALLDAYGADSTERAEVKAYAAEQRSLTDIDLQSLSAEDRRVVLQHAVLLAHVDGDFSEEEQKLLSSMASQLRIPDEEAKTLISSASERANRLQSLLR